MPEMCLCRTETARICHRCETPICQGCEERLAGNIYCSPCRNGRTTCAACGSVQSWYEVLHGNGSVFCEPCFEERFAYCDECGDAFQQNGNRFCGFCHQAEELSPTTFNILKSSRRIGMEIEYIPGDDNANLSQYGSVVGDGSVYSESRRGQEFVSSVCSGDRVLDLIDNVCREIRSTGGTVNKTCGLHIHLDMNNCNASQMDNVALWWQSLEKIIHGMVAPSRRDNQYSRSCKGIDLDSWNGSRYYSLNIGDSHGHGTFEVRVHNGTLDPKKIKGWIQFLTVFFDTFQNIQASEYRRDLVAAMTDREKLIFIFQQLSLPMSLKKYVVSRIKKHGTGWLELNKMSKGNPDLRMAA